ncbi:MAG: YafY family protein [Myxococcota bacterium]
MSQADRLYRLVAFLRQRRQPVTAKAIARHLEVSVRTVYRDVADLIANDVPIRGEAGVGYLLDSRGPLPPVQFDVEEVQALVLGARLVERFTDRALSIASRSALDKLAAILPGGTERIEGTPLFAIPPFAVDRTALANLGPLRQAIGSRHVLAIDYEADNGSITHRSICPLGLWFWGRHWTLAAWCELRSNYRNFRIDRISGPTPTERTFPDEAPYTMDAYLAHIKSR